MAVTGDFGRLTATINALRGLANVPSQVAAVAAPRITGQMQADTSAQRDPFGRAYAPHKPATVKRWGPHPVLNLTGAGIGSLEAKPQAGSGIEVTADTHMAFTQAGTPTQVVRAVLPNRPGLPATWRGILEESSAEVIARRLKVAG
jgi:hypothetical protein